MLRGLDIEAWLKIRLSCSKRHSMQCTCSLPGVVLLQCLSLSTLVDIGMVCYVPAPLLQMLHQPTRSTCSHCRWQGSKACRGPGLQLSRHNNRHALPV